MPATDPNAPCIACEIVAGRVRPAGGVVLREGPFVLHGAAAASPVRGWLVLTSVRHVRALYGLEPAELSALGPLAARVQAAQRAALGAEHAYALAVGDVLRHFHLHLVPSFAGAPPHLRGTRVLDASPEHALPAAEVEAAAAAVGARLGAR